MEFNEKDTELIENYLDDKLSVKEKKEFEKRLLSDKTFAETFELRKTMPGLFKDAAELEKVRSEVGEAIRREKASLFGYNRYWVFAAAATILIMISIFITVQFTNDQNEQAVQISQDETEEPLRIDHPPAYAKKITAADIHILSPVNGQIFKTGIPFRLEWTSYLRYQAEIIIINSGSGKITFRQMVRLSDTFYDMPVNKLKPGVYNWYLMDTIYKGSFVIEQK